MLVVCTQRQELLARLMSDSAQESIASCDGVSPVKGAFMETIAAALLAWIIAKTGLTAPALPPVVLVPQHRLVEIAFGPFPPATTGVSALYERKTGTIYMLEGWNGNELMDRSELLHELVHHVQNTNSVPAACLASHERQAIHLQLEWLREQGVQDPYEFMNINELYVLLVSSCRDQ